MSGNLELWLRRLNIKSLNLLLIIREAYKLRLFSYNNFFYISIICSYYLCKDLTYWLKVTESLDFDKIVDIVLD